MLPFKLRPTNISALRGLATHNGLIPSVQFAILSKIPNQLFTKMHSEIPHGSLLDRVPSDGVNTIIIDHHGRSAGLMLYSCVRSYSMGVLDVTLMIIYK